MSIPVFSRLACLCLISLLLLGCGESDNRGLAPEHDKALQTHGDINCNGAANEIADAVMFSNYFVGGLPAFGDHLECSISESDVNRNGIALEVGDLVYLIRIIVGDAHPYPTPPDRRVTISYRDNTVYYDAPYDLGAAWLIFRISGNIDTPILGTAAGDMDMKHAVDGDEVRVLIYNIGAEFIPQGNGELLTVPGDVVLTDVEIADYDGSSVDVVAMNLPASAELHQNYPNPFNGSTCMSIALPTAATVSLTIRGMGLVAGVQRTMTATADAGIVTFCWDGRDDNGNPAPPGMYYYMATINGRNYGPKIMIKII